MVGLDVTHQVRVTLALVAQIAEHHQHAAADALLHAVEFYAKFYTGLYAHIAQEPGCFAHSRQGNSQRPGCPQRAAGRTVAACQMG